MRGLVLLLSVPVYVACTGPETDDGDDRSLDDTSEPEAGDDGQGGGHGGGPVDNDGDGVPADQDCDDSDPSMPSGDADCDGTPTADDCDDTDPGSTVRSEDADCDGVPNSAAEAVCHRWTSDRADLGEGTWDGSVGTCDPGAVEPAAFVAR